MASTVGNAGSTQQPLPRADLRWGSGSDITASIAAPAGQVFPPAQAHPAASVLAQFGAPIPGVSMPPSPLSAMPQVVQVVSPILAPITTPLPPAVPHFQVHPSAPSVPAVLAPVPAPPPRVELLKLNAIKKDWDFLDTFETIQY